MAFFHEFRGFMGGFGGCELLKLKMILATGGGLQKLYLAFFLGSSTPFSMCFALATFSGKSIWPEYLSNALSTMIPEGSLACLFLIPMIQILAMRPFGPTLVNSNIG